MEINQFDQFEQELLVKVLNHRFDEPEQNYMPLFIITYQDQLNMSLIELDKIFGPDAKSKLERWFDIEVGKPGKLSRLRLHTGSVQLELYHWLKSKNLLNKVRRDKIDGIFDSWPDIQEYKIQLRDRVALGLD